MALGSRSYGQVLGFKEEHPGVILGFVLFGAFLRMYLTYLSALHPKP